MAVDEDEAGAAQPEAATEAGSLEAEMVSQHVQQRSIRFGVDFTAHPVDEDRGRRLIRHG